MGSNDIAPPGVISAGLLVGDVVGYGPWTMMAGLGVMLLGASPT